MDYLFESRKLANFITCLLEDQEGNFLIENNNCYMYNHIGALITDIILQSGLNYKSVVLPRVQSILNKYPDSTDLTSWSKIIKENGLHNVIMWKHEEKLRRYFDVMSYLSEYNINTCEELRCFILKPANEKDFITVRGVGPKTVDYLKKLLCCETVVVDRHIYSFVDKANIDSYDYYTTKKIVEYAADFLKISRRSLDQSIWNYMSNFQNQNSINTNQQFVLEL